MASPEGSPSPSAIPQVINAAKTTAGSPLSPLRHRILSRASTFSDSFDAARLRRTSSLSSTFSDSIDDARNSIKSTTDDILLPRARSSDLMTGHEPSHWHSIPLALALLPAAGGLFFEKGSVVITDITLLALAAIFLNWSVRLPWDWYHSAQAINVDEDFSKDVEYDSGTILEEDDNEANESCETPPPKSPRDSYISDHSKRSKDTASSASNELRLYELLALLTCFVSPMIGAWLLHHIRAQLSRPSEGLVSNYNLTIFLLASELRPLSHLIKLVQARTLHLQRTVSSHPYAPPPGTPPLTPSTINDLSTRLADLETHVADTVPTSPNTPSKFMQSQLPDVTVQIRKSLQPDLDALNRAVRRYEKRTTLLAFQTEKRLQELEARMGDAITLAAAAERSSQTNKQRRRRGSGPVMTAVDWAATAAFFPIQLLLSLLSLPGQLASGTVALIEDAVRGRRSRVGSSGKRETRNGAGKADGTEATGGGKSGLGSERKRSSLGAGTRTGKKAL